MSNRLPASASAKLAAIEQSAADAAALAQTATQRVNYLEGTLIQLAERRESAPEHHVAEIEADIATTRAEVDRLKALQQARYARRSNDTQTATQLRHWLTTLSRSTAFEPVPVGTVTLLEGETIVAAIERVRARLGGLQRELRTLHLAPLPAEDLKAKARQLVAELAQRGRPSITTERAKFEVKFRSRTATTPGATPDDVAAFYAWLNPDQLAERLEAEIAALPVSGGTVTAAHKVQRDAELVAQVLDTEREEECLIEQALAAGQDVARRPHASPLAILGIRTAKEARAA